MRKKTFKLEISSGAAAVAFAASAAWAQPTPQQPQKGQLRPPSARPPASALPTDATPNYRASRLGWTSKTFTIRGRLEEIIDGKLIVSQPVSLRFRQEISEHRQVPLNKVPAFTQRGVLPSMAMDDSALKGLLGKEVQIQAYLDSKGFAMARSIAEVTSVPTARP